MEVDHPVAIGTHALTAGLTILHQHIDACTTIEDFSATAGGVDAEDAVAGPHGIGGACARVPPPKPPPVA